jgi:DNA-binding CsgD family transcriptional regulator
MIDGPSIMAGSCTIAIGAANADSNGRRNTPDLEVAMSIRKRRSDRAGRAPLPSPGRPPVAGRDEQRRFWLGIAAGLSSEDAAFEAGVSQPGGTRWFRKAGGMPPAMFRSSAKLLSGRYLSPVEREEIALLRIQGHSMQEIGRRLGRSASTISRELRRNAATRSGGLEYRATTAQWHAERSARRPKPAKLALNANLRTLWRRDWPASSSLPAAFPLPVLQCLGRTAGMASDRIGDGPGHGARSR